MQFRDGPRHSMQSVLWRLSVFPDVFTVPFPFRQYQYNIGVHLYQCADRTKMYTYIWYKLYLYTYCMSGII